ncbi:uncharacterized protein LOC130896784 [Diorhabda carinulata]|uniref:uncharacterized protein LOC130896784 n=1 Tax=Diorhabda carinulata TaxID=1163345 RepID=UPI0025A134B7|nr:uncharacterized protein LOC130896784 [Diorhabda carinulata]
MATVKRVRNRKCVPILNTEGTFIKPIINPKYDSKEIYCQNLPTFQRMHSHHTLSSARRFVGYKPFSHLIPKDELDFVLNASFNQTSEVFPSTVDIYSQPETRGIETGRQLRNTRDLTPVREVQASVEDTAEDIKKEPDKRKGKHVKIPHRYNFSHKVLIGGVTDKKHPSNIKLMNSSHHSPQTNAGYSRQDSDGNVYQY